MSRTGNEMYRLSTFSTPSNGIGMPAIHCNANTTALADCCAYYTVPNAFHSAQCKGLAHQAAGAERVSTRE
jgi:hypothetical protein